MQIKKYMLQTQMESLKEGNTQWFKDYLKQVLESEKSYFEKTDYIAYSINEIQYKINYIAGEIKELQALKKSLENSKEIALQTTANVLSEYGIDKIEGTVVSSITITTEQTKSKEEFVIKDENAVMHLGFVKFSVDEDAIKKAFKENSSNEIRELKEYVEIVPTITTTPAKIKINNKRSPKNSNLLENSKQAA